MTKVNYESGHMKVVSSFEMLLHLCKNHPDFRPSRQELTIASMENLLQRSRNALFEFQELKTVYDRATNERERVMSRLRPLVTKSINAFKASGAHPLTIADANFYVKKIRGSRSKKIDAPPAGEAVEGAPVKKTHSVAQLSIDSLIAHFSKYLLVIGAETMHNPNEQELTVLKMQEFLREMEEANSAVKGAYAAYMKVRVARDQILYGEEESLVAIAKVAKAYIKSLEGSQGGLFAKVNGIYFKAVKYRGVKLQGLPRAEANAA